MLAAAGVRDRCDVVAGDFFAEVPAGADAYLIKNVLHDWDDDSCIRILKTVRVALTPASRVVVLGSITEAGQNDEALALAVQDMAIMAIRSGATRTVGDYERLFHAADLRLGDVVELDGTFAFQAVEALPR